MRGRAVLRVFLASVVVAAGALAVSNSPRAASAQALPEKPVVYNHITQAGATFDGLVHQTYDAAFKVVDFSDRDGVYVPPDLKRGRLPEAPVDDTGVPIKGKVIVFFIVTNDGRVVNPVIINSSDSRLNPEVLDALAQWEFVPARVNGQEVSTAAGQEFELPARQ